MQNTKETLKLSSPLIILNYDSRRRIKLSTLNIPQVTAGGKSELELELPMMEVVQTHVIPTISAVDTDILNSICSLGCFKDREKLIQELLSSQ